MCYHLNQLVTPQIYPHSSTQSQEYVILCILLQLWPQLNQSECRKEMIQHFDVTGNRKTLICKNWKITSFRSLEWAGSFSLKQQWCCHVSCERHPCESRHSKKNKTDLCVCFLKVYLYLLPFSFQLTVEMFDYLECELNLFLGGKLL